MSVSDVALENLAETIKEFERTYVHFREAMSERFVDLRTAALAEKNAQDALQDLMRLRNELAKVRGRLYQLGTRLSLPTTDPEAVSEALLEMTDYLDGVLAPATTTEEAGHGEVSDVRRGGFRVVARDNGIRRADELPGV